MKLNPKKCSFGLEEGKFLGHVVTTNGIQVNPEKTEAIQNMQSPRSLKEVQSLNGRLAALNRFLAKSAEKTLPFCKTLKNCLRKSDFRWTDGAEKAFRSLKKSIAELPELAAPEEKEELIMYLSAATETISSVLLTERKKRQIPIYFVSRTLQGPEINYTMTEKIVLSLVHTSRRLRRYFQGHPITVLTDQPIRQILSKPEKSGRLAKWAIELGEHDIQYKPRNSYNGQVMADFIAETPVIHENGASENTNDDKLGVWSLHTDGASSSEGAGAGMILTDPQGSEYTYAIRFNFPSSNNESEYEALLAGLRIARRMGVKHIKAKSILSWWQTS